jgi:hypothetical protein
MIARKGSNVVLGVLLGTVGMLAVAIQLTDAGTTGKKQPQHGAHVHGSAKLDIAVEDRTATIELESPAESIIGFEHKAKTDADQQKQAKALDLLKNRIGNMVIFEPALGCRWSPTTLDVMQQGQEHSEVRGTFAVSCDRPLAGSKVRFAFAKTFPAIRTVYVQVIAAAQQGGAMITQDRGEVEVPR